MPEWSEGSDDEQALDSFTMERPGLLAAVAGYSHWHHQMTTGRIGWCHIELGEYEQAFNYCRQALTLYQQLGNREDPPVTAVGSPVHHQ